MKMTKKRIIIGLFLFIIVIIWIIFYCFYPSKDQVGDEIYSGKYFDSAYDAYKDDDVPKSTGQLRSFPLSAPSFPLFFCRPC